MQNGFILNAVSVLSFLFLLILIYVPIWSIACCFLTASFAFFFLWPTPFFTTTSGCRSFSVVVFFFDCSLHLSVTLASLFDDFVCGWRPRPFRFTHQIQKLGRHTFQHLFFRLPSFCLLPCVGNQVRFRFQTSVRFDSNSAVFQNDADDGNDHDSSIWCRWRFWCFA